MSHEALTSVCSAIWPWLALVWCFLGIAQSWMRPHPRQPRSWMRPHPRQPRSWMRLRLQSRQLRGWTLLALTGGMAALVLLVPIHGLPISRWVAGLNTNFSIPFTAMLAAAVGERAFGRPILAERDWITGWVFGATTGIALYPFALGVGSVDPYEWGWRFSLLFIGMGALTAWLIWKQNRCGVLLLLAIAAFQARLLESTNYWDYLVDPIYWLVSLVVLVQRGVRLYGTDRLKASDPVRNPLRPESL